MTTWQLLTTTWHLEPSVMLGCGALLWAYAGILRGRLAVPASCCYVLGVMVLFLALLSPLDSLADTYLFSAHMLQHLLLVLIVPPLLLSGLPEEGARRTLVWAPLHRSEQMLRRPLLAWSLGIGTLCIWHAPRLYNAALSHAGIHIIEHLCFLVTAAIFWWPVLAPLAERRLAPLTALVYLATAAGANTCLGIVLTFAPPGTYPAYLNPTGSRAVVSLLRHGWGLSPVIDQQLGGLLMWVPGGLVFLTAILGTCARWYRMPETDMVSREL